MNVSSVLGGNGVGVFLPKFDTMLPETKLLPFSVLIKIVRPNGDIHPTSSSYAKCCKQNPVL